MLIENPKNTKPRGRRVHVPLELYYIPLPNQPRKTVPLTKVDYDVVVAGTITRVAITQHYKNYEKDPINVFYQFPVNESSVFGGLTAEFQGRTVQGKIKEKQEAKAEFEERKKQGDLVAYAETKKSTPDIMNLELGNFPGNEELKITFVYYEKLAMSYNKLFRVTVPSTLTPRYEPQQIPIYSDDSQITGTRNMVSEDDFFGVQNQVPVRTATNFTWTKPYTWNIKVRINKVQNLTQLFTTTHKDACNIQMDKTSGSITFKDNMEHFPNKDFEMFFTDDTMFEPQVAIGKVPAQVGNESKYPEYCAEISFVPEMFDFIDSDAIAKKLQENVVTEQPTENPTTDDDFVEIPDDEPVTDVAKFVDEDEMTGYMLKKVQSEYIFVLDRSGSMEGNRIEGAKKALEYFLRSLPADSYFNVISFGSRYEMLYRESRKFDTQILNDAISKIHTFSANFGGTKIYNPLVEVFGKQVMPNYQRNIFLLTDGSVRNPDGVIKLIEQNCKENQSKVFTVGVGNGCSSYLVTKAAKAGQGKHEFIPDNSDIEAKIVQLLAKSYSPSITDFDIKYDSKNVNYISPIPNKKAHILRDEPLRCYVMFSEKDLIDQKTTISVKYYSQALQMHKKKVFALDLNKSAVINSDMFHKIAVKNYIDESKKSETLSKIPSKKDLVDMAINYQVLCDETAFICVIKENNSKGIKEAAENVIVPNLISSDYKQENDFGMYNSLLHSNTMLFCQSTAAPMKMGAMPKRKR